MINRLFSVLCFISIIFISCENEKKKPINHIEKIESSNKLTHFLESPLLTDEQGKNKIDNLSFNKERIVIDSRHNNQYTKYNPNELDTIIRYTTNKDTIEVFKNYFAEKVITLKVTDSSVKLSNGVSIGMKLEDFNALFYLNKLNIDNSNIGYEDEFFRVIFTFKDDVLEKVLYERYLD